MKTRTFILINLLVYLIVISCSNEEDGFVHEVDEESFEQVEINKPPNNFNYSISKINSCSAFLSWDKAIDPEADLVQYSVTLGDSVLAGEYTSNSIELSDLSESTTYLGKIIARDNHNNSREVHFSFTTPESFNSFERVIQYNGKSTTGLSLVPTVDGGFLMLGQTTATLNNLVFLIKTDSFGNTEWQKTVVENTISSDQAIIKNTEDGGFIMCVLNEVIKLDSHGSIIWSQILNCAQNQCIISSLAQTDNGYVIVSTENFLSGSSYSSKPNVAFLDINGNLVQDFYFDSGSDFSEAVDILVNPDGTFIMFATKNFEDNDFWIVNLDAGGNINWEKTYGDFRSEFGCKIVRGNSGNYILAGHAPPSDYGGSRRLINIDAEGNTIWDNSYGPVRGYETIKSISKTLDGGFIASGWMYYGDFLDLGIFKFDSDGNEEWRINYTENFTDLFVRNIRQTEDGGYILLGTKRTNDIIKPTSLWLLKIQKDGRVSPCVESKLNVS